MTTSAADFTALAKRYKPAELRAYYLEPDVRLPWRLLPRAQRKDVVALLFIQIGLSDEQIGRLLQTTKRIIKQFRGNKLISHGRRPNVFAKQDSRDDIYPPVGWKSRWGGPLGDWVNKPIRR